MWISVQPSSRPKKNGEFSLKGLAWMRPGKKRNRGRYMYNFEVVDDGPKSGFGSFFGYGFGLCYKHSTTEKVTTLKRQTETESLSTIKRTSEAESEIQ